MINVSLKPIFDGIINGNALRINDCLIWFDFGIENESNFDKSVLFDLELPHLILLTNFPKTSLGGLPILNRVLMEKGVYSKIPVICTEPIFRFGNNVLSDIIQGMSIKDQERGLQYTCNLDGYKNLPFNLEDIEGILGDNVCRLRYYQTFNIQLLQSKNSNSDDGNSVVTNINLKALPSGLELGSTIWNMTIISESGNWEFVYVADTVSHPYWHVTPSDLGNLNKPDVLILGINTRISNFPSNSFSFDSNFRFKSPKSFSNRLNSIKKFVNTLLDCFKKNKSGTILIPTQLDSLLLELLCYLDAVWNKGKLVYPIFVASPLIKSFLLSVKTLIEWMSLEIRSEFCDSRFNPFHDLKNIILETNLRTLRNENLTKIPKIIFASPESMDYGYSRELFSELASNDNNTILFIREPKENTFAHFIWNKELGLRRSDNSYIQSFINSDSRIIPTNILENNEDFSYSIELPIIRFTPYRQDELYAMYLSHKESKKIDDQDKSVNKELASSMVLDDSTSKSDEIEMIVDDPKIEENNNSGIDCSNNNYDMDSSNNTDRFVDNDTNSNSKLNSNLESNLADNNDCLKVKTGEFDNQNISSSIQAKIDFLRSRLVPVNFDEDLVNLNTLSSNGSSSNSSSFYSGSTNIGTQNNQNSKPNRDDYGCLLDNETLQTIIDSWKDASSDLDVSSYYNLNNKDDDRNNLNSGNSIQIMVPKRRRDFTDSKEDDPFSNLENSKEKETFLESNGKTDSILIRNSKASNSLVAMGSIESNIAFSANNIPEWRIHFRQLLGGTEPFRITHDKSKIEVRSKVVLIDGLELKSGLSSLLPLINSSNPRMIILLSDSKNITEETIISYYKTLLMSLPNPPRNIVSSKVKDENLIEFSLNNSTQAVSFDSSVWDDISTGGFQIVQNGSTPSAVSQSSGNFGKNSISNYYAFSKVDNISAKTSKDNQIVFVKKNTDISQEEINELMDSVSNIAIKHEFESNSLNTGKENNGCNYVSSDLFDLNNFQTHPYKVLNELVNKTIKRDKNQPQKKIHREILLSKSRGLRHIVSEMRKQKPLPIINISPKGGIISVNNAVAFSSNHLNRNFRISDNDQSSNSKELPSCKSSFIIKKGKHLINKSSMDDVNIWNLHATLHPYYYIARGIIRNQFAIL
ncbi:Cleavage and polyadenylation specificity factor subunit 2 [Cryptosporidium felis]|nr:Cleavage and polyadenylation specificity factor subunit 2 [Cryptosporidium felis]